MILKVLLVLFLIYFIVSRFFGFLIRPFLSFIISNQQRRYQDHESFRSQDYREREGELKIKHIPNNPKKSTKDFDGGEYVDYEELKE